MIGVGLLLLSRALLQRLDGAYFLTLALLAAGAFASLLKGFDWEEASVLTACFVALLPCHRYFYRVQLRSEQPFSLVWTARVLLALIGTGLVARALVPPPRILEGTCGGSSSCRRTRRARCARSSARRAWPRSPPSPRSCGRRAVRHERASAEDLTRAEPIAAAAGAVERAPRPDRRQDCCSGVTRATPSSCTACTARAGSPWATRWASRKRGASSRGASASWPTPRGTGPRSTK